ncbi:LytTR family DNA-binding domain-containing protein [Sandaracinobacteroides hominis]|uniref:LytTR family DNA-binding domain-containing protein n=1 Tax=Sandaracinobacteroides hominis TaxID=2780086 RepID=UPI0018F3EB09|nr:LytTR family DNA-binding domain-containing protein [Sandaracinobacteroides hominis]
MTLALIVTVVTIVNTTSILMQAPEGKRDFEAWEPLVWETSSGIAVLTLVPLIYWAYRRWPPVPPSWRKAAAHLGTTVVFAIGHVALLWSLRSLAYGLMGGNYAWGGDGFGFEFLFEWRNDVLSYCLILMLFWIEQRWRQPAVPAVSQEALLSFRTGGGTVHLRPSEIRLVEAAGNYVEIEAGERRHLVRMTLAAAASELGPGFVQVHRSRLVNRDMIRAEKPQASGDVLLDLSDGTAVMASRRYRDRLPSAAGGL